MIRMLPKYYDYQKCCKKCKCKAVGLHSTVRLCNPVVNTKNTASLIPSWPHLLRQMIMKISVYIFYFLLIQKEWLHHFMGKR